MNRNYIRAKNLAIFILIVLVGLLIFILSTTHITLSGNLSQSGETYAGVSYSSDGTIIAALSSDNCKFYLWNSFTGQQESQWNLCVATHGELAASMTFSSDSDFIAIENGTNIEVMSIDSQQTILQLVGHTSAINDIAYSPDGQFILSASSDNRAIIWNVEDGSIDQVISGHTDGVVSASYSPDGNYIVTSSYDNTARVWETTTGEEIFIIDAHNDDVMSAAYSADGTEIVTTSRDRTARIWDASTGIEIMNLGDIGDWGLIAHFSPDGRWILTASYFTGYVKVWSAATGQLIRDIQVREGDYGFLTYASFSPDNRSIITLAGGIIKTWNLNLD